MRSYRVAKAAEGWPDSLPFGVHTREGGPYGVGETFETEFSEEEEAANLESGLLELLPMRYRVIGSSDVYETPPGQEFEASMRLGQEKLLLDGGFIEKVEEKEQAPKPGAKKASKAKED